ncbi:hypothetical protein [Pseudobacteriovorax antillogorgiicola]|uniref:hypothetical protein n=1 Tax=Pseudobacteriovorax antillogorgiicola TaxID=1513793 RepID=UPI001A9D2F1E|nr:hypothetical protein [Pseudobacteriovorax antillogorgiicola]
MRWTMVSAPKKSSKKDPFKTKKSRTESVQVSDTVEPPAEIKEAIDHFRDAQEQAKHFEAEATVHKDAIMEFASGEFCKRSQSGLDKSYKILGDESMVTYVVMDSSAGLTEDELDMIRDRWGEDAAEELVVRDYRSIRFDPKVLEANYDAVVDALQTLPEEVLENLFKPMLMKAAPGALERAKKHVKSADELSDLIRDLKLKHYIR